MSIRFRIPFMILVFVFAAGLPAAAQDCLDYSNYLHWRSCGDPPVAGLGITVIGDLAYVSQNIDGLVIYDISDPGNPVQVGAADTPGVVNGHDIVGDYAYVAHGYSPGFSVVDISDPTDPFVTGMAGTDFSYSYDAAMVVPDTVWVADGYGGLHIMDVSDPYDPQQLGVLFPYSAVWDVLAYDGYAYVADELKLRVFELARGAYPDTVVGEVDIPGYNYGLEPHGSLLYVAGYDSTAIVNIADPYTPVHVATYYNTGRPIRMETAGNLGYFAQQNGQLTGSLEIVDLTIPSDPVMVGKLSTYLPCLGVGLRGKYACVGLEGRGMFMADVRNPEPPPLAGTLPLPVAQRVAAAGDVAFVASQSFGLDVVRVGEPGGPSLITNYTAAGYPWDLELVGDRLYIAFGVPGFEIVDVSEPETPTHVGSLNPLGTSDAITAQGDWVFLGARDYGIQVVDISTPSAPVLVETFGTSDWPLGLVAVGDHLLMACRKDGLQVADISNPLAPSIVTTFPLPGDAIDVFVQDGIAYVSGDDEGMHIFDVGDPSVPALLATLRTPGTCSQAVADGDLLYIADLYAGLQIANVSDPAAPFLIGSVDTENNTLYSVALADARVCLADGFGGLHTAFLHCPVATDVPEPGLPERLSVSAHPNPFNPRTTLVFGVPGTGPLDLKVYDVSGRLVRTLLSGATFTEPLGTAEWDGRDEIGRRVAAGVYLCRLELGALSTSIPVTLVK